MFYILFTSSRRPKVSLAGQKAVFPAKLAALRRFNWSAQIWFEGKSPLELARIL
jgi:hypothetical protein